MVKISVEAIKHSYQGEVRIFYGGQYNGINLTEFVTPEIQKKVNERVEQIRKEKGYYNDDMHDIEVQLDVTIPMLMSILADQQRRLNNLEGKNDSMDGY